ncbi:hypothetical protein LV457_11090 [Mycobacterium sp. MYCO198283]|uniref:hypothetical protein n=1 Tax=Mycobacterium sp. MYCO198283 TaxID=2883505 RepID=UPI001E50F081|nr:hypothetical protein [Mycobacterium sp. MYCO198283]MCG5432828.1 hypothetical protein [Mycobacterium sp. MYCO198283]
MKTLLAGAFCLVVGAEALALALPDRATATWVAAAALVLALVTVRHAVSVTAGAVAAAGDSNDPAVTLRRWLARTHTLINWSDASRRDWDRHLRPLLARQFATATGQVKARNPDAYRASGELLFGTDLWAWVDPDNVIASRANEPGPGRDALEEILRRLEQL